MNKTTVAVAALAAALAVPAAWAHHRDDDYGNYGYYGNQYAYARVVSATPIYDERYTEPHRQCWNERTVDQGPYPGGGALAGAIIGGVIGHQFGRGSGRDAATVAGAIIGANVGEQTAYARGAYGGTYYRTRCRMVQSRYVQHDGYDVTYRYDGRLYHTTMPYDPGRYIRVNVNMNVVPDDD